MKFLLPLLHAVVVSGATPPLSQAVHRLRGSQGIDTRILAGVAIGEYGFCDTASVFTYALPTSLDLTVGSSDRPTIDGMIGQDGDGLLDDRPDWQGTEYDGFLKLNMFNGGKNSEDGKEIATAYIGYDCANKIVCVAAHLSGNYLNFDLAATNGISADKTIIDANIYPVIQSEGDSWVRFGEANGDKKLFQSTADTFAYLIHPDAMYDGGSFTIGYEGCWSTEIVNEPFNNKIEIHFNRNPTGASTTSTGKGSTKSANTFVCLKSDDCNSFPDGGPSSTAAPPTSDTTPATVVCPADVFSAVPPVPDPAGTCTGYYNNFEPDEVELDNVAVTSSDNVVNSICELKKTVTWTAEIGGCSNQQLTQEYIFKDTEAPVILEPENMIYECGTEDPIIFQIPSTVASDDCNGDSVDTTPTTNDVLDISRAQGSICNNVTTTVWTSADQCGNQASATQTVTVKDTQPPKLEGIDTIPEQDYLASRFDLENGPQVTGETGLGLKATDTCDAAHGMDPSITYCDVVENLDYGLGVEITRKFFCEDGCGNVYYPVDAMNPNPDSSAAQKIVVQDNCDFAVSGAFSGSEFSTNVLVTNMIGAESTGPAGINVTVSNSDTNLMGDLRGVFFDITGFGGNFEDVTIKMTHLKDQEGHPITLVKDYMWKCDANGIERLTRDVIMKGGGKNAQKFYTCAVEVGTPGKSRDDISSATFEVLHTGLTTHHLSGSFGFRHTSVGPQDGSAREDSSKNTGNPTCMANTANVVRDATDSKLCDNSGASYPVHAASLPWGR